MKQIFYFICLLAVCTGAQAQNVGIGTTTPTSKLTVVNGGVGIEHNDGTISIKSTVGFGIGMFGTYSNHPFNLTANNTAGQLVIMPTGIIGIGNSNPTLAGLIVDKKVGAANAMFGSDTTGVTLESNWPGVGFNSYYSNGRKYMAAGYGGVIGFNPNNGYFTLASTAVTGTSHTAATTTDILTATNTGNIGIGTSTPSAKLHVNGTFKLTDGTQGADKVLTSDASGNASWKTASAGNIERFAFQLGSSQAPYTLSTIYNLGTAVATQPSNGQIKIAVTQAGLYHIDISANSEILSNVTVSSVKGMQVRGTTSNGTNFGIFYAVVPYIVSSTSFGNIDASYDKSIDIYISAGDAFFFTIVGSENQPAANSPSSFLTITGHLIAS